MEKSNDAVKILEEEYGIRNMAELNEAIAKLGLIDLSPFCEPVKQNGKEKVS
ncbi:hypothetical protein [Anaerotruncus colihominis]|uniref:hypothetical protein n=1 Tax=Anaerotruncus colihominis TaxID=169435 RepID=UPI00242AC6B8|nr:hypothetical protein [Anaerotruncus colihominis]